MTNFMGQRGPLTVSDDVEKKIEEVNKYLVTAREEADKAAQYRTKLQSQIDELEATKSKLVEDIFSLETKAATVKENKEANEAEIRQARVTLDEIKLNIGSVKKEHDDTVESTRAILADIEKQLTEIASERSALRAYASALDEKERKLDTYNEKIKRTIDSLKT